MKCIYKFFWDCGRSGELDGVFIAEEKDVIDILGKDVYFGEVLGKHSEIFGVIDEGDITQLTCDADFIARFEETLGKGFGTGLNPLDYIEDNEGDG